MIIKEYLIEDEQVFNAILSNDDKIIIFIKVNSKNYIPISSDSKSSIASIKRELFENYRIQIRNEQLIFNNQELEDSKFLYKYRIINNSVIDLKVPINVGLKLQINVIQNNNQIIVDANSSDSIKDIKMKIKKKLMLIMKTKY